MGYITAIKRYQKILKHFSVGVVTAFAAGFVLVAKLNVSLTTGVLLALFIGYGVMLVGFTHVLHEQFGMGSGSIFHFIEWIGRYPELIISGFFAMAASFIHQFIMWHGPFGTQVTGLFYHASIYDAAAFYAFLVGIPTTINFIVSMEVEFYQKYKDYFKAVIGGTLSDLSIARDEMVAVLVQEIFRMEMIQLFFMLVYMVLMRYFLMTIGFTQTTMLIFFLLCIGYAAMVLGTSLMLLLLYFDDRKGAAIVALLGFSTSLILTLWWRNTPAFYGLGMTISGCIMFLSALIMLLRYVNDIDFHVFCGQPVFAIERKTIWMKTAHALDARALKRAEKRGEA